MKVVDLLERRRPQWQELDQLCDELQTGPGRRCRRRGSRGWAVSIGRLARISVLAYAYQLPQNTVQYLHRLVGRAHNQLYRSRRFELAKWTQMLLFEVPRTIFHDRCVQIMFCVFWGLFILAAYLAYSKAAWPDFAEQVLGHETIESMEKMYENPIDGSHRDGEMNMLMAGFYTQHNTGIGLQCFAWGLLVVPGMLVTMFNAITLGAVFGYMARPDVAASENFFHFVTAHGPFELTAIVLMAGAGLRLGLSWMMTGGLTRGASLRKAGRQVMPIVGAAMVMFFMAALIEGFLSPSGLPYELKIGVALFSSTLLGIYFIVLGFPSAVRKPD